MPLVRKIQCLIQEIHDHGSGVYTLELAPKNEIPSFRPGQFLHLALDVYDPSGFWPDSRAFSIASSPSNRNNLRISYSVKGIFTGRMEKELRTGSEVWIKLPYGDFVISDNQDVVLIAGGTGITAFSAFLETLKPETKQNINLFYGARSENLLVHNQMLTRQSRTVPNFHLFYALETAPKSSALNEFPVHIGQLAIDWIWNKLSLPAAKLFFLSGPPSMLHHFSEDLRLRQISDHCIRIDAWD